MVVLGTGTEVGKTFVGARLLEALAGRGASVAARKPAQSFDPSEPPSGRDGAILAAASSAAPEEVCPPGRSYPIALAPPMAARVLGQAPLKLAELVEDLQWPDPPVDVGLVETAGGARSPQADDGDAVEMARLLDPDAVVVVADAGLGTIHASRCVLDALGRVGLAGRAVVVLNRFEFSVDLHQLNRSWLTERDHYQVVVIPGEEAVLAAFTLGTGRGRGSGPPTRPA